MARKTKGKRVNGLFSVIRYGSACMGNCALETPFVVLANTESEYRWYGDNVEYHKFNRGDLVDISAFERHNHPGRLYRVKVNAICRASK